MAYQIANAPVQIWPFPHIYVQDVFPDDFYADLVANLPEKSKYSQFGSNYKGRQFADPNEVSIPSMLDFMKSDEFDHLCRIPFLPWIKKRFGSFEFDSRHDLRLIRDSLNYSIGPHTDAPWKVLSYLFYLPSNFELETLGTSIYQPNDPSFRCIGGPHHSFDKFHRIHTVPFWPNTMLAFFKTDYSFHGVEPITIECQRDVLLWNLYANGTQTTS